MTTSESLATETVTLPSLGKGIEEATLSRWLAAPGDHIETGAPLLEVATDKVDAEIVSPYSGVLIDILVAENDTVPVGTALATIATGPAQTAPQAPTELTPPPARPAQEIVPALPPGAPPAPSPAPAETVSAPASSAPASQGTTVQRLPRIRQTIARRMMESLHTTAQLTTVVEVDVTAIAVLRREHKARFADVTGTKLSFLPFFTKAAIEALTEHPVLTATVNADCTEITYHDTINLGIAVDGPKGLMVPVIPSADTLTIIDIATAIADLADHVRRGTISPDALVGGTFTITNTGSRGALFDTPILNQPQSAILGTGAVVERVVPWRDVHGSVGFAVRSMAYLSASYDHRVVDGADAARFLATVKACLESGFSVEELFAEHGKAE